MVNDNQSSGERQGSEKQASSQSAGTQGKQQGSEMTQGGASQQGSSSRGTQDTGSGAQQSAYDQRTSQRGQGSQGRQVAQGQRGGQGWREPSGSSLQTRAGSSLSPYGYGAGPFSMMRRITDEMDRLFESFGLGRGALTADFGSFGQSGAGSGEGTSSLWSPHIEVRERDAKLVISADLPGVKKEDVSVELNSDSVTIQGRREHESTTNERGYYHSERIYGSFCRTIPLPEGTDIENATATFRDGVLQIELQAPRQQSRGRTLEIKSDDASGATRGEGGQRNSSGTGAAGSSGQSGSGQQR